MVDLEWGDGSASEEEDGGVESEEEETPLFREGEGSDSSEDEEMVNTIGESIPLEWYSEYDHVGYDVHGEKVMKSASLIDALDRLLQQQDNPEYLKTIYDKLHDKERALTDKELDTIRRIRSGMFADPNVEMYQPFEEWVPEQIHPLSNRPVPKRRFIPSKHEGKKIAHLVRLIRKGLLRPLPEKTDQDALPNAFEIWEGDAAGKLSAYHIPPPRLALPGNVESYNPPEEYLFTKEEQEVWEKRDPSRRLGFIPKQHDSLRHVGAYSNFIKERFERCLDLYLCPRVQKTRTWVDPETLLPSLPDPKDLRPFPSKLSVTFKGHQDKVRCLAVSNSGQFLASGSDDKTVRLWEVRTGRCLKVYSVEGPPRHMEFHPSPTMNLLAVAVEREVIFFDTGTGDESFREAARDLCWAEAAPSSTSSSQPPAPVEWIRHNGRDAGGRVERGAPPPNPRKELVPLLSIKHHWPVRQVIFHHKGEYLATVCPDGDSKGVVIHNFPKKQSQCPFKKTRGQVLRVSFHPSRPVFYVATQRYIRMYDLKKQEILKKLMPGTRYISSFDVHPGGDNVIVGGYDKKVTWVDTDLSVRPYRTLRHHKEAVRHVEFHKRFPLFASCSDDLSLAVFHGMVYSDLLQNALIVPVKKLKKGLHRSADLGVLYCTWHHQQPWLFSASADSRINLYT